MRSAIRALVTGTLGLASLVALGGPLHTEFVSSPASFTAYWLHGGVDFPWIHHNLWDAEWNVHSLIGERPASPFSTGHFLFVCTSYHKEPPDPENHSSWGDTCTLVANIYGNDYEDVDLVRLDCPTFEEEHGIHYDIYSSAGFVRIGHILGMDFIKGYNMLEVGMHAFESGAHISIDSTELRSEVLSGSASDAIGSTAITYHPPSGFMNAAFMIDGISYSDLERVEIHAGLPGQDGPTVLDMGGPVEWADLGDLRMKREFTGVFPLFYQGNLMNGGCYVLVRTHTYPQGEIRGQLHPVIPFTSSAYQVAEGEPAWGDLTSLAKSDDNRLGLFNDSESLGAMVLVQGQSPVPSNFASTLCLVVETSAARAGLAENISMFNYQTGTWGFHLGGVGATDDDPQILRTQDQHARDHIGPNGQVQARISWAPINDEAPAQDGWLLSVDQASWFVSR